MKANKNREYFEEYRFRTEKFLEKIPLPYPVASVLIGATLYLIWLAVAVASGLEFSIFINDAWFFVVSSFIAFLLCGTKYCFDDIRRLPSQIREIFDMADDDFESVFTYRTKNIFSARHLFIGIPIVIAFFIYEYLTSSYWIQREYNFAIYLTGTAYWITICLILGMVSWVLGWGIQFYWWIGHDAPLRLKPFRADRVAGLNPITRQHLTATFLIAIGASFLVLVSEPIRLSMLVSLISLILFIFFAPQYYIHLRLVNVKKDMLDEISEKLHERSVDYLENLSKNTNSKEQSRLDIIALDALCHSINSTREWPFDYGIVLKVIGSAILPILAFVFQLLSRI